MANGVNEYKSGVWTYMSNELTYDELHEQLMYNPWTGLFYWKIQKSNIKIGSIAGTKQNGYIHIQINDKIYMAHRLSWFYVHGYMPENMIDHKDRVKHHNWIKNLREVSNQCNARNTGNYKNNTSGIKGVCFHKHSGKWESGICIDTKNKSLGRYIEFDEAVCARLAGEQCLNWEGCDSSSPAYLYVTGNIQGVCTLCPSQ